MKTTALSVLILAFLPLTVAAQDACQTVQSCVNTAVTDGITNCVSATPECTVTNPDKFAASAGDIAERAIATKKCATKNFQTRFACNACYAGAKAPLKNRFFVKLFHGLLGNAVSIIEQKRKERCLTIERSKNR